VRTTADLVEAVRRFSAVVSEQRQYLIDLDAAIGDADHGENMARGLQAAVAQLEGESPDSPSAVLKSVATTLMRKVGGASGPLYGTAFLRASTALAGKEELAPGDLVTALRAARDGVVARGKAEPGDKTMVDAWTPAVDAAQQALDSGGDARAVLRAAADAGEKGRDATVPLVARKGRASYLGERSAGHQDPGATSTALLLEVFAEVAEQGGGAAAPASGAE
jgi:phosphoenolpyruvate---glycerone phosphotransferase subunit DhaL